MIKHRLLFLGGCAAYAVAAALSVGAQAPTPAATTGSAKASPTQAATPATEWPDYAGSPEGSRYVSLNQITKENVKNLGVAWSYPYAETGFNPIVAHGVIYTKGAQQLARGHRRGDRARRFWIHDGLQGIDRARHELLGEPGRQAIGG